MASTSASKPGLPWHERLVLSVPEVAELLSLKHRKQVHRLIDDWAFGDPAKLPVRGTTSPRRSIPPALVKAFLAGDRQYPPGDPRGEKASA